MSDEHRPLTNHEAGALRQIRRAAKQAGKEIDVSGMSEIEKRVLIYNEKAEAEEKAAGRKVVVRRQSAERAEDDFSDLNVKQLKAKSRELAAQDPRLVAKRQETIDRERGMVARALAAAASEAYWAGDGDVPVYDEDGYEVEVRNTKLEAAVVQLMALGRPGLDMIGALRDDVGEAVDEIVNTVQQVSELRELEALQAEAAEHRASLESVGPAIHDEVQRLISLNDWINPAAAQKELDHLLSQNPSAPDERLRLDDMVKEAQTNVALAAARQADWLSKFGGLLDSTPDAMVDMESSKTLLEQAMRLTGAEVNALEAAEASTRALHAQLDESGVGMDSRDRDGKRVLVDPAGTIWYLSDDSAAARMSEGWKLARDENALPPKIDYNEALAPQRPSDDEIIQEFADAINAADAVADDEAIAAQVAWASQGEEAAAAAAEAQEARDEANRTRTLEEMNQQAVDPTKWSV